MAYYHDSADSNGYRSSNGPGFQSPTSQGTSKQSLRSLPSLQAGYDAQEMWKQPMSAQSAQKLYPGPFWDRSRPRPAKPSKKPSDAPYPGPFYDRSRTKEKKGVSADYPGPFYDRSRPRTARAPSSHDELEPQESKGLIGFFKRSSKQTTKATGPATQYEEIPCYYQPHVEAVRPPRTAGGGTPTGGSTTFTSPRAASSCGVASERHLSSDFSHRTTPSSRTTTPMPLPRSMSANPMGPMGSSRPNESTMVLPRSMTPVSRDLPRAMTPVSRDLPRSMTPGPRDLPRSRTPGVRELPRSMTPGPRELPRSMTPGPRELPRSMTPGPRELPRSMTPGPRELPHSMTPGPREPQRSRTPGVRDLPRSMTPVIRELPRSMTPSGREMPRSMTSVPRELPRSMTPMGTQLHRSTTPLGYREPPRSTTTHPQHQRQPPRSVTPSQHREIARSTTPHLQRQNARSTTPYDPREAVRPITPHLQRQPSRSTTQREASRPTTPHHQRQYSHSATPYEHREAVRPTTPHERREQARSTTPYLEPPRSNTPHRERELARSTTPYADREPTRSTTPYKDREYPRSITPMDSPRSFTPVAGTRAATSPQPSATSSSLMPPADDVPPMPYYPLEPKSRSSKRSSKIMGQPASPVTSSPKSKTIPARQPTAWSPPPLFQAYGQAVKYATLEASTLSAEAILRGEVSSKTKLDLTIEEESGDLDSNPTTRHKRSPSGPSIPGGWTQKIYMLLSTGYLLQYSGEGQFDRMPEKILRFDKDSVAFASDLLPGKLFVLQISQLEEGHDTVDVSGARSRFSRLSFRSASSRRMTSNMLLVLQGAAELDAWMSAIRKEIELVGGKKHEEAILQLRPVGATDSSASGKLVPSVMQRYSVMPNTNRSGHGKTADLLQRSGASRDQLSPVALSPVGPSNDSIYSSATSTQVPSVGTASVAASEDQMQLDRLRDDVRLSFISYGTLDTSRTSSPMSSPAEDREQVLARETSPRRRNSVKALESRRSASAMAHRRDSQLLSGDVISQSKVLRPRSTFGFPQPVGTLRNSNANGGRALEPSTRESTVLGNIPVIFDTSVRGMSPAKASRKPTGKRHRHSISTEPGSSPHTKTPTHAIDDVTGDRDPSPVTGRSEFSFAKAPSPTPLAPVVSNPSTSERDSDSDVRGHANVKGHGRYPSKPTPPKAASAVPLRTPSPDTVSTSFFLNTRDSSPEDSPVSTTTTFLYGDAHFKMAHSASDEIAMNEDPPPYSPPAAPVSTQTREGVQEQGSFLIPRNLVSRPTSAQGQTPSEGTSSRSSSVCSTRHHPPRSSSYFPAQSIKSILVKTKARPRAARVRNRQSLTSVRNVMAGSPSPSPSPTPPGMSPSRVRQGLGPAAPPPNRPLPIVPGVETTTIPSPLRSGKPGQKSVRMAV